MDQKEKMGWCRKMLQLYIGTNGLPSEDFKYFSSSDRKTVVVWLTTGEVVTINFDKNWKEARSRAGKEMLKMVKEYYK